ncbi:MAG TPA: hypothetical protein VFB27_06165 [Opitutaceae bacterium]|nr:hypothetical protein [Opitutaceae bacterium]
MKITRAFLTLAAALSLGLAVFATARVANASPVSAQSAFKVGDDVVVSDPTLLPDDGGSGTGGDTAH